MSESRPSAEILRASLELPELGESSQAKAAAAAKKGDKQDVNELEKAIVITAHSVPMEKSPRRFGR